MLRRTVALPLALLALLASPGLAALPLPGSFGPAAVGLWDLPRDSQVEAIHAVLLPTGKILYYTGDNAVRLFDPVTGGLEDADIPFGNDIFCSGHVLLPDGRVLVIGGTQPGGYTFRGEEETFFFDPWTETWSRGPTMATGRWYPTPVTLGDGRVAVFSGLDATGATTPLVEVLDAQQQAWQVVPGADRGLSLFPRLTLLPGGELAKTGHEGLVQYFDPATGAWRYGPVNVDHWQGSSVLLPNAAGILAVGGAQGSSAATTHSRILDDGQWRSAASLALPRRDLNLVLLADGDVLAVGGVFGPNVPRVPVVNDHPDVAHLRSTAANWLSRWPSQLHAERFDPDTGRWTLEAAALRGRTYHSTALLLPDGSVWVSGSDVESQPVQPDGEHTYETYRPAYLFRGPRPTLTAAPERVTWGAAFPVATPDAAEVARVALVRLGSVTHAFNFDQRYLDLAFAPAEGGVLATAPGSPNEAPPGWYMLFLLDGDGVPSVARILRLA